MLAHHNPILAASGAERVDPEAILESLKEVAKKICPSPTPVWRLLAQYRAEGKRVLYEGAQGIMLDVDYGTYPFVTSSNTLAGAATFGSGSGIHSIGYVLGIIKLTPHASAAAPSHRTAVTPSANASGNAVMNSAPSPGASAAAAGSTR